MSFLGALGDIFSGGASGALSNFLGGIFGSTKQAAQPNNSDAALASSMSQTTGIQSAMKGTDSSVTYPASEHSGFLADVEASARSSLENAISKGITSLINPSPSSAKLGRQARSFLQNEFPELNPWELSGSSSGGISGQAAGLSQQSQLQNKAFQQQSKLQQNQLDTQKEIAKIQSRTALATTAMSTKAPLTMASNDTQMLPFKLKNLKASTNLTDQQIATQAVSRGLISKQTALAAQNMTLNKFKEAYLGAQTVSSGIGSIMNLASGGSEGLIKSLYHKIRGTSLSDFPDHVLNPETGELHDIGKRDGQYTLEPYTGHYSGTFANND